MLRVSFAFAVIAALAGPQQPTQPPVFKSGVELVMVDTQVVDKKGNPIGGLKTEQFQVTIDGKRRTVVSSQLIDAATGLPRTPDPAAAPRAPASPGNIYVLAVDQGSFRALNAPSTIYAAREFIKRLQPADYVGIVSFPAPGIRIDPTRDRAVVNDAIPRLVGFSAVKQLRRADYSLSEAIDVAARDRDTLAQVVKRNCTDPNDRGCATGVEMELVETVSTLELQASRSLHGLREVVGALTGMEGRKTVIVLSAGIPSGDRTGGRLYMRSDAMQLGKNAVAAGIILYTLHLNTAFLDQYSPDAPSTRQTAMRDSGVYARGLDIFNGYAGGTFFEVNTGANFAVDRVVREMSAYYLLGVEVDVADRDGKTHLIQVKVNQKDSHVRSRGSLVIPQRGT